MRFNVITLICVFAVSICNRVLPASTITESGSDATSASSFGISPTPDLISASAEYDAQNLYLSAHVVPGSIPAIVGGGPRGTTSIIFYLDTDQNPATGQSHVGIGYERWIGTAANLNLANANLLNALGNTVSVVPVTHFSDGVTFTIPLSALGDDGLINYRAGVAVQLDSSSSTPLLDLLPNLELSPGTSSPVPEPGGLFLSCIAFGCALGLRSRSRTAALYRHDF